MSQVKRARVEEAEVSGAGAAAAAAPARPPLSLPHETVLLVLGIVAQTLARRAKTVRADVAAARAVSAAWAARPPRPDDDEGCLARARRSAKLALAHAERNAEEAPRLLFSISKHVTSLCRDTWRCVPAGLSAADAARVRAGHPIWRAVIDAPDAAAYAPIPQTRLMWAASNGNIACMLSLCEWHADVNACDVFGQTALHLASWRGQTDSVRELIAHGADVNAVTHSGNTPLIEASWWGRVDTVRLLLAAGADKRRHSVMGNTAYSRAGEYGGQAYAIRRLLDAAK